MTLQKGKGFLLLQIHSFTFKGNNNAKGILEIKREMTSKDLLQLRGIVDLNVSNNHLFTIPWLIHILVHRIS